MGKKEPIIQSISVLWEELTKVTPKIIFFYSTFQKRRNKGQNLNYVFLNNNYESNTNILELKRNISYYGVWKYTTPAYANTQTAIWQL